MHSFYNLVSKPQDNMVSLFFHFKYYRTASVKLCIRNILYIQLTAINICYVSQSEDHIAMTST